MPIANSLLAKELIVITGKGGVGKSAVSAALGRQLADAGRRTLVLEVDPRENVHQMMGVPPSGGEIVRVGSRLYLQHLQPRSVLDQVVRERVRIEFLIRKVLESPVYHHFSEGAPGLKEMAVLGHALILVQGRVPGAPDVDVVVIDAPATGHGVALLEAPQLVSEVLRQGPIARMTAEVAELVSSPERCGVVVVTLAEEMPVTEALELIQTLGDRLDRQPELVVANGLYPSAPRATPRSRDKTIGQLWRDRRSLNERELNRLGEAWAGSLIEIPFYPIDLGPALVGAMQEKLVLT